MMWRASSGCKFKCEDPVDLGGIKNPNQRQNKIEDFFEIIVFKFNTLIRLLISCP